ncbi:MAG TPA: hypothetical protein PKN86_01950 [Candidatus Obscuribacter sp.]|nr:hypothetical protein [Candidatus Obscuribacter sp.]
MRLKKSAEESDYATELVAGLKIASPCSMNFDDMKQTEESYKRFCQDCSKNVFDVASMSREQVAALVEESFRKDGTMPCMRLYRRTDGTVITDDCPVGLRRVRNFYRRLKATAAALAAFFLGTAPARADGPTLGEPLVDTGSKLRRMGDVCPPNWAKLAANKPEIKKLQDELAVLVKESKPGSVSDTTRKVRLQLKLVQAANQAGQGNYALEVLEQAIVVARQSGNKNLLAEVLQEKLKTMDLLKIVDKSSVQAELDGLKKGRK